LKTVRPEQRRRVREATTATTRLGDVVFTRVFVENRGGKPVELPPSFVIIELIPQYRATRERKREEDKGEA